MQNNHHCQHHKKSEQHRIKQHFRFVADGFFNKSKRIKQTEFEITGIASIKTNKKLSLPFILNNFRLGQRKIRSPVEKRKKFRKSINSFLFVQKR